MSYTPGPWTVDTVVGFPNTLAVGPVGGVHGVALLTRDASADNEANARLIAAAPDLYDAVSKFLVAWPEVEKRINGSLLLAHIHGAADYDGPQLDIDALRAAIAKAEGKPS